MASSNTGQKGKDAWAASPTTGGPMGTNKDAADPSTPRWFLGDTSGPLGKNDHADPDATMRPHVTITYVALDQDLTPKTPRFKDAKRISKTLAMHGGSFLIHGNSRIVLKQGGVDVSAMYPTYRAWRIWVAPLDPKSGEVSGPYNSGSNYFTADTLGGGASWIDVPGQLLVPGEQKAERFLLEFLVGVDDHPEWGGIVFLVAVDTTPTRYRVRMHKEHQFTGQEWKELFPMGYPKSSERTQKMNVGLPVSKPFGSEADFPVIRDSGWQDFPK